MAEIEFHIRGKVTTVAAGENETLLDAALRNNVDAPYSCMEGICSSCTALITAGEVEFPPGWVEDDEQKRGIVLTCQARLKKGCARVVVDYDKL